MLGQYQNERFGPFSVIEVDNTNNRVRVRFDRTKHKRWTPIHILVSGRIIDNKQPWYNDVGFNDYHRDESYFAFFRAYWKKMIRESIVRKTHTMDPRWYNFDRFYKFVNKPENEDLHVAMTAGFLVAPRNHHYGPDSMIVVPNLKLKGFASSLGCGDKVWSH